MEQPATQTASSSTNTPRSLPESSAAARPKVRLRAACDSCHRSKTKCSGGAPCLTCQLSEQMCTYSRGSKLGRPKGSKNKRAAEQKEKGMPTKKRPQSRGGVAKKNVQPESLPSPFDLDCVLDTPLGASDALDELLNPVSHASPNNHQFTVDADDAFHSLFSQELSPALSHSPFSSPNGSTPPTPTSNDSEHTSNTPTTTSTEFSFVPDARNWHAESSKCTCLQQQVELVYQLGNLQDFHTGTPTLDRVLQNVEMAQRPWLNLMRCDTSEHEREVFLLFATSIRILHSSIRRLRTNSQNAGTIHEAPLSMCIDEDITTGVSVGSFKLTGDAKQQVIAVLIDRALHIISSAVLHLRSRTVSNASISQAPFLEIPIESFKTQTRNSLFLVDPGINAPQSPSHLLDYSL